MCSNENIIDNKSFILSYKYLQKLSYYLAKYIFAPQQDSHKMNTSSKMQGIDAKLVLNS